MTSIHDHGVSSEFPFACLLRSSDRELILVQLMTSVWETILQLPILPRNGHDRHHLRSGDLPLVTGRSQITGAWEGAVAMTGPRSFAAMCAGIMHGREPQSLMEAEVQLPTVHEREVFEYEEGSRVLNDVVFACRGQRARLAVLQPRR